MNNALPLPSNRSFGWTFTVVFALIALFAYPWLLALAALTAAVTVARDQWLEPLNRAWMRFGALLNRIVSPVVLGLIYFTVFTPVAVVMRLAGRDAMCRRFEPAKPSYWVTREPPGPREDSFRDMF
ncbi:MAG TPA: SxtJ family membrane protein [Burkholderiales bacterium]